MNNGNLISILKTSFMPRLAWCAYRVSTDKHGRVTTAVGLGGFGAR